MCWMPLPVPCRRALSPPALIQSAARVGKNTPSFICLVFQKTAHVRTSHFRVLPELAECSLHSSSLVPPRSLNSAQGLAPKNVDTESRLLVGFFRFETSPLDRAWAKSLGHQMTPASHPRVSAAVEKHSAQLPSGCLLLQCLRGSGETPPAYLGEFSELKVTSPV